MMRLLRTTPIHRASNITREISIRALLCLGLPVSLGVSAATGGCAAKQADPVAAPNEDEFAPRRIVLVGAWRVVSIETALGAVEPPESSEEITLEFQVRQPGRGTLLTGSAGVNRFTGEYVFSSGEGSIGGLTVTRLVATRMAGPEDAMDFERSLLETLESARTVTRATDGTRDDLIIDCSDAQVRLTPKLTRR